MFRRYVSLINRPANFYICATKYPMTHRVFVYGTLKSNEPNHFWLTTKENGVSEFIGEGVTNNTYPLIIATKYNIPFLLDCPGMGHNVKGEVYKVDDTMLGQLDILEDHPNYYEREISDIMVHNVYTQIPEPTQCWVYFLKRFKPELLQRPMLQCYSSAGGHGLPYQDSQNESTPDDLDEVLAKKKS